MPPVSRRWRELERRVPGTAALHPLDLGRFPTDISSEPALAAAWELRSLHVKRDDLCSPLYGGSKVRALEFLLGRARACVGEGGGVLTLGPTGSHHVLTTAIFSRSVGLRCRAVLFPQPDHPDLALHARVLAALDVECVRVRTLGGVGIAWLRAALKPCQGRRPLRIPAGATSPLGLLGAVEGALEVVRQIDDGTCPRPDQVVVPVGSGGTAAGLLLGFALARLPLVVVGVRVVPRLLGRPGRVRRLARRGRELLRRQGLLGDCPLGPLLWISDCAGRGYAHPTPAGQRALAEVARLGSFRGETTYTGKALAYLATGAARGRRVLFWNTFSAVDPDPERLTVADGR